ncbi:MAG: PSD1 domain-containing protein [Pirellulaceae bacterium]|nr:PSD1 domain-containing protein [Pirellulaceae bacterium]
MPAASDSKQPSATFETNVRPILREYCLDCHGASNEIEASLDLRLARFILAGGDSGPAIVPGDPEDSLLVQMVSSGQMPPGEVRLSPEKVSIIRQWIAAGAQTESAEPESIGPGIPLTEHERSFWAYQPLDRPQPSGPQVTLQADRIRTGLDAVIAQDMPQGLTFSEDADRVTLVRRVYYDLLGLPPNPADVVRWTTSADPNWYSQMVDQLLCSPAYGQRWARHWLDAAGYADSDGFTVADQVRPWAWRYRDYVIRAMNQDRPFDQFICEQLAGDELAGPANGDWTDGQIELLTATGFLRMAADGTGSGDNSPEARNKTISDTLQIVGSSLLASSLHCAQCHDHRYDPISQRDYFALRAVFSPALDWQNWKTPGERLVSLSTASDRQLSAEVEAEAQAVAAERQQKQSEFMREALDQELLKFDEPLRSQLRAAYDQPADSRTAEQRGLLDAHPSVNITPGVLYQYLPKAAEELKQFDARIAEVRSRKPADSYIQALIEPPGHLPATQMFYRGDFNQPLDQVEPGGLSVLSPVGQPVQFMPDDPTLPTSGRRLALARWLTSSDVPHPLFTRAMINRVWLHHFGRGIVATAGDFGRLGSRPSHPQVLDWLALHWIDSGWSLKALHRVILNSTVYRQSSAQRPEAYAIDPENQFYWRKPLLRLEAEVLRDSVLALSGKLSLECDGPPMAVLEDETGQVRIDPQEHRRSIYASWRRTQPVAMLQMFDAPVMAVNCDARSASTVVTQALLMMNSDFIVEHSGLIAAESKRLADSQAFRAADYKSAKSSSANAPQHVFIAASYESPSEDRIEFPQPPQPVWHYGTGTISDSGGRVEQFRPLPHFTGSSWQGGWQVPDRQLGWVLLTAHGGHPGNVAHPAIRRWVAPSSGQVTIVGKLEHGSENGDGVCGRVCIAEGTQGTWTAFHGSVDTPLGPIAVTAGQPVDFVVDCQLHETSDSFAWPVVVTFTPDSGPARVFESAAGFAGPAEDYSTLPHQLISAWSQILLRPPSPDEFQAVLRLARDQLTLFHQQPERIANGQTAAGQVLTNVCQTLISCNEFLYID